MPACLPACLPACTCACLLARLAGWLAACLLASVRVCIRPSVRRREAPCVYWLLVSSTRWRVQLEVTLEFKQRSAQRGKDPRRRACACAQESKTGLPKINVKKRRKKEGDRPCWGTSAAAFAQCLAVFSTLVTSPRSVGYTVELTGSHLKFRFLE